MRSLATGLRSAAHRQKKNPPRGCGPTSAGGRGLRERGGGGGGSADDVASVPAEPSSGNLTDSSTFDFRRAPAIADAEIDRLRAPEQRGI